VQTNNCDKKNLERFGKKSQYWGINICKQTMMSEQKREIWKKKWKKWKNEKWNKIK